jgi:hypothetical protein
MSLDAIWWMSGTSHRSLLADQPRSQSGQEGAWRIVARVLSEVLWCLTPNTQVRRVNDAAMASRKHRKKTMV